MGYIANRLREPSTWAGLGVLYLAIEGFMTSGDYMTALPGVLGAVIAVLKGDVKP